MNIDSKKDGGSLVVKVSGRLDTMKAPELEEFLNQSLEDVTELAFDLSELEYISSAGLRTLLGAQQTMDSQGSMVVRNVPQPIMEILEVTGFTVFLTIE